MTNNKDAQKELVDSHYPPLDVAKARIKQALLKYQVRVGRTTPTQEKGKVRL